MKLFRCSYMAIWTSNDDDPFMYLSMQNAFRDQFYVGETLDGRTGLVPSNYGLIIFYWQKISLNLAIRWWNLVEQVPDTSLLQNAARAPSPLLASGHRQTQNSPQAPSAGMDSHRFDAHANSSPGSKKVSVATQSPPVSSMARSLPPNYEEPSTSTA